MPFIDTHQLPVKEILPDWQGRYFNSDNMTFGHYTVAAGASIHEHSHPQEEVWHIIAGELEVTIAGQTQVAGPSAVAIIPAHTVHSVKALSDGQVIVVDYPLRNMLSGVSAA